MLSLDQMELDLNASFFNYKLDLGNKRQRHSMSWRRKWQPTAVFLPREFHGQRGLQSIQSTLLTKSRTRLSA